MSAIRSIVKKEVKQIRRDRRMLPMIFFAPAFQIVLLGYAATMDVKDVPTAIVDGDRSSDSRTLARRLGATGYFEVAHHVDHPAAALPLLDSGAASLAVILPKGFARALGRREPAPVQLLVDGTDTVSATIAVGYATMIIQHYMQAILMARAGGGLKMPVSLEPRVWYNPELKSRNFMIPSVVCLLLLVMTTILTAMAVVKERERGTIEQLIVTPIRPVELIIGKFVPFVVIGFIDVAIVVVCGSYIFDVPVRGSVALLFALSGTFLMNTLGMGLLVSTAMRTQQQAMLAIFFLMLPSMLLSGFAFPIASMPEPVQALTYAIPLRYFITIVRGIFLKGVGLEVLWPETLALFAFGLAVLALAAARFRKRL